jgi:hypothetical protein
MFKEALTELAGQAVKAAGPQVREIDPTKTFAVIGPDGKTELIGNQTPWRRHRARDLETIAAFADRFEGSSIWYAREGIACLIDDSSRRERVILDMDWSDEINKLIELEENYPMLSQRDLLYMLRTVFTPNSLPKFPKLIDTLRQVKFEAGAVGEGNIQRGKSSVGKSMTAAASFVAEVPEQVTLTVPIFNNSFARKTYDVICALEIFEAEQKLQLFPLPGMVEGAFAAAEADLCKSILDLLGSDTKTPVYFGVP